MERALLSLCYSLIRLGSWLVPGEGRAAWRAEWTAEVVYASRRAEAESSAMRWALLRRCLGAIPDGLCIFAAEWSPALHPESLFTAGRDLSRSPGRLAVTVLALTLSLGCVVGAWTAACNLLRPTLPFPNADRYVRLEHVERIPGTLARPFSREEFEAIRAKGDESFETLIAYRRSVERIERANGERVIVTVTVSPEKFPFVPVHPILGRGLQREDGAPGAEPVAVVSQKLWREEFGGSRGAIGDFVTVGGARRRIVGVMPGEYETLDRGAAMWVPLPEGEGARKGCEGSRNLLLTGRLRPGVELREASAMVARTLSAEVHSRGLRVDRISPPLKERIPPPLLAALLLSPGMLAAPFWSGAAMLRHRSARRRLSRGVVLSAVAIAGAIPCAAFVADAIDGVVPAPAAAESPVLDFALALFLGLGTLLVLLRFARWKPPGVGFRVAGLGGFCAVVLAAAGLVAARSRGDTMTSLPDLDEWWAVGIHDQSNVSEEVAARVRAAALATHGIVDASCALSGPFDGVMRSVSVVAPNVARPVESALRGVDDETFRALGLHVEGDGRTSSGAVVNHTLAERLALSPGTSEVDVFLDEWARLPVVGIVDDASIVTPNELGSPSIYVSIDRGSSRIEPQARRATLLVRAPKFRDAAALHAAIRPHLESAGAGVGSARRVSETRDRAWREPRSTARLAGIGFGLALSLAAAGFAVNGAGRKVLLPK